MKRKLIYNARLVDALGEKKKSALLIEGKKIAGFPRKVEVKKMLADDSIEKIDAAEKFLMPSFIDTHAHFRDPGLTYKEDIESGCRAAAAGGFGAVVLMPNTKPVVSSIDMARANNEKAESLGLCRVIQAVSITENFDGKTISHLEDLRASETPVISEDGKEVADSAAMLEAMKAAAKKNIVVSCHCEDSFLAEAARPLRKSALELLSRGEKKSAAEFLGAADEMLRLAEDCATLRNLRLAESAKCHIHLCHVSTAACVEAAKLARKNGARVTFEVTPHHIALSGEKAPAIFNIVNPPLRSKSDCAALIQALKDGTADCIGTDHAPHSAEDKKNGSPGFSGIETAFAVCNSVLIRKNGMSMPRLSQLMSANPAKILGLKNCGLLEEGFDANLVLADSEKRWKVEGGKFFSKGKFTPLEGKTLFGKVCMTIFNGKIVFKGNL